MDFWRWSLLSLFAFMVGGNLPCDRLFDLLSVCAVLPCDLCFLDGKSKRFRLGTRRTSGMVGQQERWYEEIGSSMECLTQLGGEFDKNVVIDSFYFGGGEGRWWWWMAYLPKQPNNVLVVLLMEEILHHLLFIKPYEQWRCPPYQLVQGSFHQP